MANFNWKSSTLLKQMPLNIEKKRLIFSFLISRFLTVSLSDQAYLDKRVGPKRRGRTLSHPRDLVSHWRSTFENEGEQNFFYISTSPGSIPLSLIWGSAACKGRGCIIHVEMPCWHESRKDLDCFTRVIHTEGRLKPGFVPVLIVGEELQVAQMEIVKVCSRKKVS